MRSNGKLVIARQSLFNSSDAQIITYTIYSNTQVKSNICKDRQEQYIYGHTI